MATLLLDTQTWDLVLDANRDIAVATGPYALAQDAASAIRLFINELYYDQTQGIRYRQEILGKFPPLSLVKADMVNAALTVPGVVSAKCVITGFVNRRLTGQIQIRDVNGNISAASF